MRRSRISQTTRGSWGLAERCCAECQADISQKRSDAIYCARACKTRASDRRRANDGRSRSRDRERYPAERDHRISYARAQYWADPEKSREYSRAYRKENPDVRLAQYRTRRARKLGSESRHVSVAELESIKNRQGNACYYCGLRCDLVIDHVIPLAKGGRHAIGNLVGACWHCNSQKCAMLLIEWKRFLLRKGVSLTL